LALLEDLITAIETSHSFEPARAGAVDQLDAFEKRAGFPLPPDLRAFYLRIHRAEIAGRYQLLPVQLFQRTGCALHDDDEWEDSEPPSWYAFCDVYDGDFVGIELERSAEGHNRILDCDHDDISSRRVVAASFSEFLERALSADRHLYYLDMGPVPIVEVHYRPPVAWLKREYEKWSRDPEIGPRVCAVDDCGRLCVSLSVHCRRHHFEAIQRQPYPFDD
jgi:hypothetical protein